MQQFEKMAVMHISVPQLNSQLTNSHYHKHTMFLLLKQDLGTVTCK